MRKTVTAGNENGLCGEGEWEWQNSKGFSFPSPQIPFPRLAKIKLKKTQMWPLMGFKHVTSQVNVLVATTTPHVCLC